MRSCEISLDLKLSQGVSSSGGTLSLTRTANFTRRAVRGALAALNLVDNTEYSTHEDESHTKNIDGVYITAAVITSDRPAMVDLDVPLDLDLIDFPASDNFAAGVAAGLVADPDAPQNGTIFTGSK